MAQPSPARLRGLYRRFLRELPSRPSSTILSAPSPLQQRIRASFVASTSTEGRLDPDVAEQFIQYLHAQRMYATLLERYNPGMNMNEEERVRLTARRVGMDLPVEFGGMKR